MKLGLFATLALVIIGLALGLVIAGSPPVITLAVLAGAAIFCITWLFPAVIIAGLLALVPFNILWVGKGITIIEAAYGLTFLALACSWLMKRLIIGRQSSVVPKIRLPVLIFLGITVFSCFISIMRGNAFRHWGSDLNALMYFAMCLIAADIIKDKKQVYRLFSVMTIAMVMGLIKGLYVVSLSPKLGTTFFNQQHTYIGLMDIPALVILLVCLSFAAASDAWRKKVLFTALSVFFAVMQVVSLARSLWIAVLFGIVVMMIISSAQQRTGIIKIFLTAALIFFIYVSGAHLMPAKSPLFKWAQNIEKRINSFTTLKTEAPLLTRRAEIAEAARKALRHPVIGNGLGTEITYFRNDNWYGAPTWETTRYIHNAYLFIFLNMGIIGLLAFMWLMISAVFYSLKIFHDSQDRTDKAFALGISAAFLSLMLASLGGPLITSPAMTIWIGFLLGALAVIERPIERQKEAGR